MSTLEKSKFPLIHWFSSTKELVEIGFTKKEISDAILKAKTTLSDLTDDCNYTEKKNSNYIYSNENFYEIIDVDTTWTFTETKIIQGKEFKREYLARAIQYRTFSKYNSHDGEILQKLLETKFPYLKEFKIEYFAMRGEAKHWDIYVKTLAGSLYVPVNALFKKDPSIIKNRMLDYCNEFRNQRDPNVKEHNHKEEEHQSVNGGCPLCQQEFYEKEIAPLQTIEASKLFEEMKN